MRKFIPNTLTSLNLFSGCIASVMAFNGEYSWVVFWVIIAALFDFSDGFAARILKRHSPIGKELDSLADAISFGFAPSVAIYSLLSEKVYLISNNSIITAYLPYAGFIIAVFSALRLAKFNVDDRQSDSFIGFNTPANAMFWVSFCCGLMTDNRIFFGSGMIYTILVGIIAFSLLMVSELPMFSLKVKDYKIRGNEYRYFLIVFTIAALALFGVLGISAGILLYIALSAMVSRRSEKRNNV